MKKIMAIALFSAIFSGVYAQKIIGYIPQYRTTQQMDAAIEWDKMTDYYYFGSVPTASGGITIEQPARFQHVLNRGAQYNKNVWLCVGGWNKSGNFITVARNATARQAFANEALRLCQLYDLEGIDIDWEFPAYGQENDFKEFLKTLYQTLNPAGYLVSAAAGGEATHADKWLDETFDYIDDLNIMSYDAPASVASNHASLQFMKDAMDIYHQRGCDYEKMLGGVAFYSRCAGVLMYSEILNGVGANNKQNTFLNDNTGGFCYNGKNTITDKVDYVMQQGGIGILIWEVTQDVLGQYSLLNASAEAMEPYLCDAPKPTFTSSPSICGLQSVTLNGGVSPASGLTFTWKKGDQVLVNKNASSNTYQATSSGTYTLEVHKGTCFSSSTVEVTGVLELPDLGGPYELCDPTEVTLDAAVNESGRTITWSLNNQLIAGANSSTLTAKKGGSYQVTVSANGCSSVSATAVVNSDVPYAESDTVCLPGMNAFLEASEEVRWYATEASESPMETGDIFEPTVNNNTTYWMSPSGSPLTQYSTLLSSFPAGWNGSVANYARKIEVISELTLDAVSVNSPQGGSVTINLRSVDGSTVVRSVTQNIVGGGAEINLNWSGIPSGEYMLDAVGSSASLNLIGNQVGDDFVIPGVLTSPFNGYSTWGYGYSTSTDQSFFYNLKVTAGKECAKVPVAVVVDENNMEACLTVSANDVNIDLLKIYPNPSNANFNVVVPANSLVNVFDVKGLLVSSKRVNAGLYSFGDALEPGVYIVNVMSNDSTKVARVVKK